LEITVSAEVELVTILNANKKSSDHETRGWDIIHQHDTPSHITMLPRLNPIQVQNLLKKLEALITRNKDDWQVQVRKEFIFNYFHMLILST
jgi:hypothetical protein